MPTDPKSLVGVRMHLDIAEKLRDISYWDREPIGEIVEGLVETLIAERERARGSPYPKRPRPLKRGRRPRPPA